MTRERPTPPPFESVDLERSLDRYLVVGLLFMAMLIVGFGVYKAREPALRKEAAAAELVSYRDIGAKLFSSGCASCHGKGGVGGSAPVLYAKEFLKGATDRQIQSLIAGGVPGTDMSAWGVDFGGTLTDEQLRQITVYLRSLDPTAPSVPDWRGGR